MDANLVTIVLSAIGGAIAGLYLFAYWKTRPIPSPPPVLLDSGDGQKDRREGGLVIHTGLEKCGAVVKEAFNTKGDKRILVLLLDGPESRLARYILGPEFEQPRSKN